MYCEGVPSLIVFARHGESLTNKIKKNSGPFCPTEKIAAQLKKLPTHLVPLTPDGKQQALQLGRELDKLFHFDVIIDSTYVRSRDTANLAATQMSYEPIRTSDPQLRERNPGYGYSMTAKEFNHHFPYMKSRWKHDGWFYRQPPGGESCAQVLERGILVLRDIFRVFGDRRVLIISHGRFIQTIQMWLEDRPLLEQKAAIPVLGNCQWVAYEPNQDGQLKQVRPR